MGMAVHINAQVPVLVMLVWVEPLIVLFPEGLRDHFFSLFLHYLSCLARQKTRISGVTVCQFLLPCFAGFSLYCCSKV